MKSTFLKSVIDFSVRTTVDIHEIPEPKAATLNDLQDSFKVEYAGWARWGYRIFALLSFIAPVCIYYYSTGELSFIVVGIGSVLGIFFLYIGHKEEIETGFIVSKDGIKNRYSDFRWSDVTNVQVAMIHKPGARSTFKHIRITSKKGTHHDYKIAEISARNDNVPNLVKAYYRSYQQTVANSTYPQAGL